MVKKVIAIGTVAVLILASLLLGGALLISQLVTTSTNLNSSAAGCGETDSAALSVDTSNVPKIKGLDAEQAANYALIINQGKKDGMSQKAQLIAGMTAFQESKLQNITGGDRDSGGLFQQRPSQGWGTREQITTPAYAAHAFYKGVDTPNGHIPGLADIKGWESMTLTQAAQAVQKSGYPDAYAQHEALMRKAMSQLAGVSVTDASASLSQGTLGCDDTGLTAAPEGLPTQAELAKDSSSIACPEGSSNLGVTAGGYKGKRVPIRLCSITGTVCTGSDCRQGELGGKAKGEVVLNSLVAPHFIAWLKDVRAKGKNPVFSSSFRSWETQGRLAGTGSGNVARNGYSNHQMGTAVDISGLAGSYNRNQCSGHTKDGACKSTDPNWNTYHSAALSNGADFHDEEFWHMEWIITRADSRDIPFIKER